MRFWNGKKYNGVEKLEWYMVYLAWMIIII